MMRPRGKPFPPSAMSTERLPLGIPGTTVVESVPSGMIAPCPNSFSICARAVFSIGLPSINESAAFVEFFFFVERLFVCGAPAFSFACFVLAIRADAPSL